MMLNKLILSFRALSFGQKVAWGFGLVVLCVASYVGADWYTCLPPTATASFVGRNSCQKCHQQEFDKFVGSDHDKAMDLATDETVLADFNNAQLEHDGITSKFFRKGSEYWVETEGEDGSIRQFQVKYVFGHYPLQQYMVEFDRSSDMKESEIARVQVLRLSWDVTAKKWFYLRPPDVSDKLQPDDPLFWTKSTQCWNTSCADCHSTNLHKGFDLATKSFHTTFSEIDVSCEACHGPASLHVQMAEGNSLFWDRKLGKGLAKLKGQASHVQVENCARCHSRRRVIEDGLPAGQAFHDVCANELLTELTYHSDGQIKDEDYEWGSFTQSKMFHKAIRCTDCHDPHSSKIKVTGNNLCTSCHQHPAGKYDSPAHHQHKIGSTGASCVECHMPKTIYMDVDPRRDHSIRIPRPDLSLRLGTPNACTQCHLDKAIISPEKKAKLKQYQDWVRVANEGDQEVAAELKKIDQWCAESIEKWYPNKERPNHVADVMHRVWENDPSVLPELKKCVTDKQTPTITAASLIAELNRFPGEESSKLARDSLKSEDAQILVACLSIIEIYLQQEVDFGGQDDLSELGVSLIREITPLLSHSKKSVRLEAARVLTSLRGATKTRLQGDNAKAFQQALDEYRASLELNSESPGAHFGLALIHENLGEELKAAEAYVTAIKLDPGYVGPRSNLAALYDRQFERLEREAKQEAQRLVSILPSEREPIIKKIKGLEEQGFAVQAKSVALRREELPLLKRDAERSPNFAPLQYRLGMLAYLNGENALAGAALKRAFELDEKNPQFALGYLLHLKSEKKWREVFELALQLTKKFPGQSEFPLLVSEAEKELNRPGGN